MIIADAAASQEAAFAVWRSAFVLDHQRLDPALQAVGFAWSPS